MTEMMDVVMCSVAVTAGIWILFYFFVVCEWKDDMRSSFILEISRIEKSIKKDQKRTSIKSPAVLIIQSGEVRKLDDLDLEGNTVRYSIFLQGICGPEDLVAMESCVANHGMTFEVKR